MGIRVENGYGSVYMSAVMEIMPIRAIKRDIVPADCFMSLEQAEQVALITGNDGLQPVVLETGQCFYIRHHGTYQGVILRVSISFKSDEVPADELERLNKGKGQIGGIYGL